MYHLVYEFYVNLKNKHNNKVFVKGVWVPFTAEYINRVFYLPHIKPEEENTLNF